mgnify:CR=1 FL=1|tara:strand:+ start:968 stop:1342 length:375 start_codon:yes stop_codon:yes gene_type:complete
MVEPTKEDYVEQAMEVLHMHGYCIDYMWHTDDVVKEYPWLDKEHAHEVLILVMENEKVQSSTEIAIKEIVKEKYPEEDFDPSLQVTKKEYDARKLSAMILDAKQKGLPKKYIQALQNKYGDGNK